ncbi:MAG TPA: phospholipase D-like domain-containing protein [archaeon]|nr:phospholipase D-like domain-containing protein [archaeon]
MSYFKFGFKDLSIAFFLGVLVSAAAVGFLSRPAPVLEDYPLAPDSVVVLNDRDYFPTVLQLVQSAKESIHGAQFEAKFYSSARYSSSSVNQLVSELAAAKARGVDVKLLVDEYAKDNSAQEVLRAAGVEFKFDDPHVTTHAKLWVIDGRVVVVGSTNLSHFAFEKNHEANVVLFSEGAAREFGEYFQELWESS